VGNVYVQFREEEHAAAVGQLEGFMQSQSYGYERAQNGEINSKLLSGRVPAVLGGRLLHTASLKSLWYTWTTYMWSTSFHCAKRGIAFGVFFALLLIVIGFVCWWKRKQNILSSRKIATRDAPYAKARTHFVGHVKNTLNLLLRMELPSYLDWRASFQVYQFSFCIQCQLRS
ncbi:hypothetical protein IFM89_038600, partial [Coptis chinensis]